MPKKIKEPEIVKVPVWRQHGFKKLLGGILTVIGGILYLFNNQAASTIGMGLVAIGTVLTGVGGVHTVIKKQQGVDRTQSNVWATIAEKVRTISFKKGK